LEWTKVFDSIKVDNSSKLLSFFFQRVVGTLSFTSLGS
jgi:hypothetical protein